MVGRAAAKNKEKFSAVSCYTALNKDYTRERNTIAQEAGVSTAPAARAQALVTKRPYLASEVAAGSIQSDRRSAPGPSR